MAFYLSKHCKIFTPRIQSLLKYDAVSFANYQLVIYQLAFRNIPEDLSIHQRHCEMLKSRQALKVPEIRRRRPSK
jgi:hypothetical protein